MCFCTVCAVSLFLTSCQKADVIDETVELRSDSKLDLKFYQTNGNVVETNAEYISIQPVSTTSFSVTILNGATYYCTRMECTDSDGMKIITILNGSSSTLYDKSNLIVTPNSSTTIVFTIDDMIPITRNSGIVDEDDSF